MVKLVPECAKCGSPVSDSVEPEVEEQGQLKRGKYVNSVWICNDCAEGAKGQEEKEKSSSSSSYITENKRRRNNDQSDSMGIASPADVFPNTPRADEAGT